MEKLILNYKYQISVVIAAYNVESFIDACLESVFRNYYKDLQVIIIDDGSTDQTKCIIDNVINKYASVDNSLINAIIFKSQKNAGIARVRNLGVTMSEGRYITFLDGDDVWSENYIETLQSEVTHNFDIIEYDCYRFEDIKSPIYYKLTECSERDMLSKFLFVFKNNKWFVWSRLFKATLLKSYHFPDGRRYEDSCVVPLLYLNAEKIKTINAALVYYRNNASSITNNHKASDVLDLAYNIEYLLSFDTLINNSSLNHKLAKRVMVTNLCSTHALDYYVNGYTSAEYELLKRMVQNNLSFLDTFTFGLRAFCVIYCPVIINIALRLKVLLIKK